jgi:hypothetical protein
MEHIRLRLVQVGCAWREQRWKDGRGQLPGGQPQLHSHPRHSDCSPGGRSSRRIALWPRVHSRCRGHLLLSRHTNTLGATLVPEAINRPSRDVRRPLAVMVTTSKLGQYYEQHHYQVVLRQHTRTPTSQTHAPRASLELENTRTHCAAHFPRLEHLVA